MNREKLLEVISDNRIVSTCAYDSPRPFCLTHCSTEQHLHRFARNQGSNIVLLTYPGGRAYAEKLGIEVLAIFESDDLDYDFVSLHNRINETFPRRDIQNRAANIHPSAIIGAEGSKIVKSKEGKLIRMKHMGAVILEKGVRVGALSVIHRGTLYDTVVSNDTDIGSLCSIGHNVFIGRRNVLTARVGIAGSVDIGDDCFFGIGSMIKNGIHICSRAMIGAGAVVTRDIQQPGVYAGVSAKRIGDWDGNW